MCDRIAIMKEGEIVQIATPAADVQRPAHGLRRRLSSAIRRSPSCTGWRRRAPSAVPGAKLADPLPASVNAGDGTKLTLGVRPEHFSPAGDVARDRHDKLGRNAGPRKPLRRACLPDGSVLRSIQPSRARHRGRRRGDVGHRQPQRASSSTKNGRRL